MSRLLAIDWSRHEARYVLASVDGSALKIEAAGSVSLETGIAETTDTDEEGEISETGEGTPGNADIGKRLAESLAQLKTARITTLVGVDRASIELLHLKVPPATDSELPEIVAHQAMHESPAITDDSIIDFVPTVGDDGTSRTVTAAVLSAERFRQIKEIVADAGLTPSRMLLRPYAVASLFAQHANETSGGCLLINLVDDEVDLSIVEDGALVFSRTVRLPNPIETDEDYQRLFPEIPRTLMVAGYDVADRTIGAVYVIGGAGEHGPLISQINETLNLKASIFDARESVGGHASLEVENSGRFAPLLGMLLDEAHQGRHAIDFLHPRRSPPPINRRRVITMTVSAVLALVFVFGFIQWGKYSDVQEVNRGLTDKLNDLKKLNKTQEQKNKTAAAVAKWDAGGVVWLDEIRDLSLKFPSSRDAVVLRLTMNSSRSSGGKMILKGLTRDPSIVERSAKIIGDRHRKISTSRWQERRQRNTYAWQFDSKIDIVKRDKAEYIDQGVTENSDSEPKDSAISNDKSSPTKSKAGPKKALETEKVNETSKPAGSEAVNKPKKKDES